jgi:hypothetical protein
VRVSKQHGHGNSATSRGQALAETAMFTVLAAVVGFGILALIPYHRARTSATSAAYGCAQFLSQSPMDPQRAVQAAQRIAQDTLASDWSATFGVSYRVEVQTHGGPGQSGSCTVSWSAPALFNSLLGLKPEGTGRVSFLSRVEMWKAGWK